MALESERCKWFTGAIELLGHVNSFPVGSFIYRTDFEYLSYQEWVGNAQFVGELDLRDSVFSVVIMEMGAFNDEQWVNVLSLSYLKYLITTGPSGSFDGLYWVDRWIRTNKLTCLNDPLVAQWVVCAIGCIETSWISEDSPNEYAELRAIIGA